MSAACVFSLFLRLSLGAATFSRWDEATLASTCRAGVEQTRVCNPDGIIPSNDESLLRKELAALEVIPVLECHLDTVQVAFVAVKRVATQGGEDVDDALARIARSLHDSWGVGSACGSGIVLLLSAEDRAMFVSTGEGAKSALSAGDIRVLIARMKPALRSAEYGTALLGAVADMGLILAQAAGRDSSGTWRVPHDTSAEVLAIARELRAAGVGEEPVGGVLSLLSDFFSAVLPYVFIGAFLLLLMARIDAAEGGRGAGFFGSGPSANRESWEACRARLLEIERLRAEAAAAAPTAAATPDSGPPAPGRPFVSTLTCCPVCLEDFPPAGSSTTAESAPQAPAQPILSLGCGHRFHSSCLDEWFGGAARNTCPVCRAVAFDNAGNPLSPPSASPRTGATGGGGAPPPADRPGDGDVGVRRRGVPPAAPRGSGWTSGGGGEEDTPSCGSSARPAAAAPAANPYPAMPPAAAAAAGAAAPDAGWGARMAEVEFLLRAIGRRYPAYVTPGMVGRWTTPMGGMGMGGMGGLGGIAMGVGAGAGLAHGMGMMGGGFGAPMGGMFGPLGVFGGGMFGVGGHRQRQNVPAPFTQDAEFVRTAPPAPAPRSAPVTGGGRGWGGGGGGGGSGTSFGGGSSRGGGGGGGSW